MSIATMILGESGTGKTAGLRNLDPAKVLLMQTVSKPLPFKNEGYSPLTKETPDGNVCLTDSHERICKAIYTTKRPIVVIDDAQYQMTNEFMRRCMAQESGNSAFQKYNEIAFAFHAILTAAGTAQPWKRIYILAHTQTNELGRTRMKTIGKLLDEKITCEGMVSIVLRTDVVNGNYRFATRNTGMDTTKTPMNMFEAEFIDNDIAMVDAHIVDFYGINQE
jgi:hypothetical protein